MKIDYKNFTEEQLEEWVEFIDWSLVPSHLLNEEVRTQFKDIKGLQVRIWFEDLLASLEIKVDKEKYPDSIFFFLEDKWYMELDQRIGDLWCSYELMWSFIEKKIKYPTWEVQRFIKNIVDNYFKNLKVNPLIPRHIYIIEIEKHFKNLEAIPKSHILHITLVEKCLEENDN